VLPSTAPGGVYESEEMMTLKPYMVFSRHEGPENGAALVLAPNSKEARKLGYLVCDLFGCDGWIDCGVLLLRHTADVLPLANQEALAAGQAHVIEGPVCCQACGQWGAGLTDDNRCGWCNEPPGDKLISRLRNPH
jgi:hypothetical protein